MDMYNGACLREGENQAERRHHTQRVEKAAGLAVLACGDDIRPAKNPKEAVVDEAGISTREGGEEANYEAPPSPMKFGDNGYLRSRRAAVRRDHSRR